MRYVAALFLVVAVTGPASGFQQQGLPPAPGWMSGGVTALLDPDSPPVASPLRFARRGVWLAASRPFGVAGLGHAEGAAGIGIGKGIGGLSWREVAGDGMRDRYLEAALRGTLWSGGAGGRSVELRVAAAYGLHHLGVTGRRGVRTGVVRLAAGAIGPAGWSGVVEVLLPLDAGRIARRVRWCVGVIGHASALAVGGEQGSGGSRQTALSVTVRTGGVRLRLGAWGEPPAPALGVGLPLAGAVWTVEGRWVPGPGLSLLWSVRLPAGAGS